MGTAYVELDVKVDIDEAHDRLEAMKDRMKNFNPVFRWGASRLERAFSQNFTMMGALSAAAMVKGMWPPLDPAYAARKAQKFPGAPMMVMTGRLWGDVSNLANSPKNVLSDMEAEYVVDNRIARFHQDGTRNMPARPIVFVPRDFDREIGEKIIQYVKHGSQLT